jgi:hypothetical protein
MRPLLLNLACVCGRGQGSLVRWGGALLRAALPLARAVPGARVRATVQLCLSDRLPMASCKILHPRLAHGPRCASPSKEVGLVARVADWPIVVQQRSLLALRVGKGAWRLASLGDEVRAHGVPVRSGWGACSVRVCGRDAVHAGCCGRVSAYMASRLGAEWSKLCRASVRHSK